MRYSDCAAACSLEAALLCQQCWLHDRCALRYNQLCDEFVEIHQARRGLLLSWSIHLLAPTRKSDTEWDLPITVTNDSVPSSQKAPHRCCMWSPWTGCPARAGHRISRLTARSRARPPWLQSTSRRASTSAAVLRCPNIRMNNGEGGLHPGWPARDDAGHRDHSISRLHCHHMSPEQGTAHGGWRRL